jgi:hypothetical protein
MFVLVPWNWPYPWNVLSAFAAGVLLAWVIVVAVYTFIDW